MKICMVAVVLSTLCVDGASSRTGLVSWYHEGQRVASGGRFHPNGISAAHLFLPFGTKVKVTNPHNHKSVVVKINDRGPAAWTRRVLDLSRGAAKIVGLTNAGVMRMEYTILN